jgi:putative membrane protein
MRWTLAAFHLLALGIGLGAVWARARALRQPLDTAGVRRVLVADTWWGIAAVVWILTGFGRLFGGFEKGAAYYFQNHLFWVKMGLLVTILLLEIWPMVNFIKWRVRAAKGEAIDASNASSLATISFIEAAIVLIMVVAATGMARGYGVGTSP